MNFCFNYLATREEENIVNQQVTRILREILTPGMNDHQKQGCTDYIVTMCHDLNYREHWPATWSGTSPARVTPLMYKMLKKRVFKRASSPVRPAGRPCLEHG